MGRGVRIAQHCCCYATLGPGFVAELCPSWRLMAPCRFAETRNGAYQLDGSAQLERQRSTSLVSELANSGRGRCVATNRITEHQIRKTVADGLVATGPIVDSPHHCLGK
jgi:hypothetical protein